MSLPLEPSPDQALKGIRRRKKEVARQRIKRIGYLNASLIEALVRLASTDGGKLFQIGSNGFGLHSDFDTGQKRISCQVTRALLQRDLVRFAAGELYISARGRFVVENLKAK